MIIDSFAKLLREDKMLALQVIESYAEGMIIRSNLYNLALCVSNFLAENSGDARYRIVRDILVHKGNLSGNVGESELTAMIYIFGNTYPVSNIRYALLKFVELLCGSDYGR